MVRLWNVFKLLLLFGIFFVVFNDILCYYVDGINIKDRIIDVCVCLKWDNGSV